MANHVDLELACALEQRPIAHSRYRQSIRRTTMMFGFPTPRDASDFLPIYQTGHDVAKYGTTGVCRIEDKPLRTCARLRITLRYREQNRPDQAAIDVKNRVAHRNKFPSVHHLSRALSPPPQRQPDRRGHHASLRQFIHKALPSVRGNLWCQSPISCSNIILGDDAMKLTSYRTLAQSCLVVSSLALGTMNLGVGRWETDEPGSLKRHGNAYIDLYWTHVWGQTRLPKKCSAPPQTLCIGEIFFTMAYRMCRPGTPRRSRTSPRFTRYCPPNRHSARMRRRHFYY